MMPLKIQFAQNTYHFDIHNNPEETVHYSKYRQKCGYISAKTTTS